MFVKQDWTIGYYGLLFHLTYFKTVLEFLRKLITKYISEKKIPSGNVKTDKSFENNVETVVHCKSERSVLALKIGPFR